MDYGSGPAVSLFVCLGPLAENLKRNLIDNFHQEIFLFVLVSHPSRAEFLVLSFEYLTFHLKFLQFWTSINSSATLSVTKGKEQPNSIIHQTQEMR